jgi:hypothetical protein
MQGHQNNSLFQSLLLFIFLTMISCESGTSFIFSNTQSITNSDEKKVKSSVQFIDWSHKKSNGIFAEKQMGKYLFSVLYKPYELIVAERAGAKDISEEYLRREISKIDGMQYLTFKICAPGQNVELLKTGISSVEEYNQRILYCAFQMQNDIQLVDGNDTLHCDLFHFERVYGIAPYATFSLGFVLNKTDDDKSINDKTLIYDDKIFGVGRINLTIKGSDIESVPHLLISKS